MLKALAAAALLTAGTLTIAATADANHRGHKVCWGTSGGGTACDWLPRNANVGVAHPTCTSAGCTRVEVMLTRSLISKFGRYIDTSTMAPGRVAVLSSH